MDFFVAQKALEASDAEAVLRALRPLGLANGAQRPARNHLPFGLLARNLSQKDASQAEVALRREGVAVEVVAAFELPAWPAVTRIRHLEIQSGHAVVFDATGRGESIGWPRVAVIAAGALAESASGAEPPKPQALSYVEASRVSQRVGESVAPGDQQGLRHILEIILTGGAARYRVEAADLFPAPPEDGATQARIEEFTEFLRTLAAQAPQAQLNRGAAALYNLPSYSLCYPDTEAFDVESLRWLWRASKKNASAAVPIAPRLPPRLRVRPAGKGAPPAGERRPPPAPPRTL